MEVILSAGIDYMNPLIEAVLAVCTGISIGAFAFYLRKSMTIEKYDTVAIWLVPVLVILLVAVIAYPGVCYEMSCAADSEYRTTQINEHYGINLTKEQSRLVSSGIDDGNVSIDNEEEGREKSVSYNAYSEPVPLGNVWEANSENDGFAENKYWFMVEDADADNTKIFVLYKRNDSGELVPYAKAEQADSFASQIRKYACRLKYHQH